MQENWDEVLESMIDALQTDEEQGRLDRDQAIEMRKRAQLLQAERTQHVLQVIADEKKTTLIGTLGNVASVLSICTGLARLNSFTGAVTLAIAAGTFVDEVFCNSALSDRLATWWLTRTDEYGRAAVITASDKASTMRNLKVGLAFLNLAASVGLAHSAKPSWFAAWSASNEAVKFYSVIKMWEPLLSGSLKIAELGNNLRSRNHQVLLEEVTKEQEHAEAERSNYLERFSKHYEAAHDKVQQMRKQQLNDHEGIVAMLR